MRSSTQRKKKYAAKTDGVLSNRQIAAHKEGFKESVGGQVAIEVHVRAILTKHGVTPGLHHFYMDFGKKLGQLSNKYGGRIFATEACIAANKWVNRGLDEFILEDILYQYGVICVALAELLPGMILEWGGLIANIPAGWALCNGAAQSAAANPALFTALGYAHGGAGDAFNLPDLRNRFVVCANADAGGKAQSTLTGPARQSGGQILHAHAFTGDGHGHNYVGFTDGHAHDIGMSAEQYNVSADSIWLVVDVDAETGVTADSYGGTTDSEQVTGNTDNQTGDPAQPFYALAYIMKL